MRRKLAWHFYPFYLLSILLGVIGIALIFNSIPGMLSRVIVGGLYIAFLAIIASYMEARRVGRPIEQITKIIENYTHGLLDQRLPSWNSLEFGDLSDKLNEMAAQLERKIRAISDQRNEQEAVFLSMMEGVLAVDAKERMLNVNSAGMKMLGLDKNALIGRFMQEVIRNIQLQKFISRTLVSSETIEEEITLQGGAGPVIQAKGSVLRGQRGEALGALVVLNDITRLRQLENIRREFVANVSHELKTPITSIKGFVETLRDGAMNDPSDLQRFLGIISRQADRLNSIIEDLLSLAKIEEGTERRQIVLVNSPIHNVLSAAIQSCEPKAAGKKISIEQRCPDQIRANINPELLEQAMVNLIDNAIKYSEDGQTVEVTCDRGDDGIILAVRDHGCGIEKNHLPRLFERFYRADKGRSREQGGTGLGLAIVKHIALAHSGGVSVDSVPGQGSIFKIHLPPPFCAHSG